MTQQKKLKLGIPKGSLQDATIALFEKSGWKIRMHHRNYFPEINDPEITCSMCRAQEMSRYVESGTLDCGLTGKDWILENESDVVVVADLVYSKVSNRPARWVLAVAADSPYKRPEDLAGKKIATELCNFTKQYFAGAGVPVDQAKATEWIRLGAQQQDAAGYGTLARYHYGVALYQGLGVAVDVQAARHWLERAAAEGWSDAAEYLRVHGLQATP